MKFNLTNNDVPEYAFPGGYHILYVDAEENGICSYCVNADKEKAKGNGILGDREKIVAVYILNGDEANHSYCDECGEGLNDEDETC